MPESLVPQGNCFWRSNGQLVSVNHINCWMWIQLESFKLGGVPVLPSPVCDVRPSGAHTPNLYRAHPSCRSVEGQAGARVVRPLG